MLHIDWKPDFNSGNEIKALLDLAGLSQKELGRQLGVLGYPRKKNTISTYIKSGNAPSEIKKHIKNIILLNLPDRFTEPS